MKNKENKEKKVGKKMDIEMKKNIVIGVLSVILIIVVVMYITKGTSFGSKDEYVNYDEYRAKLKEELTYELVTKPEEERKKQEEEQQKQMEAEQQADLEKSQENVENKE